MKTRTKVRLTTFIIAIALVLVIQNFCLMSKANKAELALEYGYLRAIEDLSLSADNISVNLEKSMYSNDAVMLEEISNSLSRDASTAKSCLSQLPVGELNLEDTYKFFSQVGNYSASLAKKLADGDELTNKEYDNLSTLYELSVTLKDKLWDVEQSINNGELLTYEKISSISERTFDDTDTSSTSFEELDSTFDNYPTLIYDGPYSDHLLTKSPELIKGEAVITKEEAKEIAATVAGVQAQNLVYYTTEQSTMPSYLFRTSANTTCAITMNGGFCSYMLKNRDVDESNILNEEAVRYAESYLGELGIDNMTETYFEAYNNILTVNFAYCKDNVIYYADLVKVSVALDNGEILAFDARGYITNHYDRSFDEEQITADEAADKVSPKLEVISSQQAVIPTDSGSELLCYEFKTKSETDADVLVYINCETGAEEQILILVESESGTLTI
ncbi:MAG: germination protein YpeB [Ruminococcus sp.]|nr:germination protein YpeB [Ruminococcus sp.]